MHFSCLKRDKKTKKTSYIYLALDSIIWRWQHCIKSAPLLHHFCKLLSIRPLKGLYKYSRVQKNSRISDTRSAVEKTLSTLTWVFAVGVSLFNSIKISKIKCVAQLFHSGCTHGHTTSTLGLSWENRPAASDTGWRDEALACPSRPQKRGSTVWDELGRFEVIWGSRTHSSPPAGVCCHTAVIGCCRRLFSKGLKDIFLEFQGADGNRVLPSTSPGPAASFFTFCARLRRWRTTDS